MQIEQFFPTNISNSFCPFHNEVEKQLIDHCFSISKTIKKSDNIFQNNGQLYTTYGTHDILLDEKFERLNNWIKDEVKKYVDTLRMKVNLKYEGNAFFNIYKKHDYQETHDHAGSMISCIYFLKSNEKSSRVFFKSRMYDNIEHDSSNPPTGNVWFESQPGKLLIFRSYVQHFVEQHLDEEERISLAYNFKS